MLDLDLAWERFRWETHLDEFETPDPFTQPSFFRRFEGRPEVCLDPYVPQPYEPVWTSRGPGSRHMACLSSADNVVMLACLAACHEALLERFAPTDGRRDFCFQLSPDPRAVSWLRSPFTDLPYERAWAADRAGRAELASGHRKGWWVRADVSSCGYSLDYRRLWQLFPLPRREGRVFLRLLQHLSLTRRHGIRSFGNALCMLVKTYLQPVVAELDEKGHHFYLTELDEFHLFAPTRAGVLDVLEDLVSALRARGLTVNRWRLAPATSRKPRQRLLDELVPPLIGVWPLASLVQQLRSDQYTNRGPVFRELLHRPRMQRAALECLRSPLTRAGDRYQVLYWLHQAGVRPVPHLEAWLRSFRGSAFEGRLVQGVLGQDG